MAATGVSDALVTTGFGLVVGGRQVHLDRRADAHLAVHVDEAAVLFASPYTIAIPSPVPAVDALVVKNGSKIRSTAAWSMPVPVSLTATQ